MYEIQAGRYLRTHHIIEITDEDEDIIDTYYQPIVIDLFRIDVYEMAYEENKNNIYTNIITHSGVPICVDITYHEFDYIYTKYVINKPIFGGINFN